MVYGKGINDMEKGWKRKSKENLKKYSLWHSMLNRCYDNKYHEKFPKYKDCYVCERWLKLSNFLEDIKKLENYDKWLAHINDKRNIYELDKDIKSNGINKCYCSEQCIFVTNKENTVQAVKTRNEEFLIGKNNPKAKMVAQYDLNGNLIKIWDYIRQASKELNIKENNISQCLNGKQKTSGGFIWKYYKEEN